MLLVIDVGNTNTVLGLYRGTDLLHDWRIKTDRDRTADEHAIIFRELFALAGLGFADVKDIIISNVVPPVLRSLEVLAENYFSRKPLVVGPGIRTGIPIKYDNPKEVGADRIVNAVAAYDRFGCAMVVVDFGTATTFDYISGAGEYLGGAIAPGLTVATEALFAQASKLPRVEIQKPPQAVARNTVNSIQSGIYYGYAGLVDGIVDQMRSETGTEALVVATGGNAGLLAEVSRTIDRVEPNLTLEGLRIIYSRNQGSLSFREEGHRGSPD